MTEPHMLDRPRSPLTTRPLLGLTVLAVEDSRFASEALRLMCLRSGARLRRADSLRAADRHLRVYRPSVMIVDPGLPDGSGLDLIARLAVVRPRIPVILGMSGDPGRAAAARQAGADGFLVKPLVRLAEFQQALLRHLPPDRCPSGPYPLSQERITPDPLAYRDDLDHVRAVLAARPGGAALAYAAQFLAGVAQAAGDPGLAQAAGGLAGHGAEAGLAHVLGLIEARLAERAAI
ncbi:MAG: response regulator [Roseovarius sp.]|nr:response regulator [Roseovarius sp.]MBK45612.1 response regulator [Roseovarius sp.]